MGFDAKSKSARKLLDYRSFRSRPDKCKKSLKLAVSRIQLLRKKKEEAVVRLKREIAKLLADDQDRIAEIRVEHVINDEKTMTAYELLELYCELIIARLDMIESHKSCALDMKEAISSVVFASERCGDIPQLTDIRKHFLVIYGKNLITSAIEVRPNSGVNPMIIEKLSAVAPDIDTKVKILIAIAAENGIYWEPKSFEEQAKKTCKNLVVSSESRGCNPRVDLSESQESSTNNGREDSSQISLSSKLREPTVKDPMEDTDEMNATYRNNVVESSTLNVSQEIPQKSVELSASVIDKSRNNSLSMKHDDLVVKDMIGTNNDGKKIAESLFGRTSNIGGHKEVMRNNFSSMPRRAKEDFGSASSSSASVSSPPIQFDDDIPGEFDVNLLSQSTSNVANHVYEGIETESPHFLRENVVCKTEKYTSSSPKGSFENYKNDNCSVLGQETDQSVHETQIFSDHFPVLFDKHTEIDCLPVVFDDYDLDNDDHAEISKLKKSSDEYIFSRRRIGSSEFLSGMVPSSPNAEHTSDSLVKRSSNGHPVKEQCIDHLAEGVAQDQPCPEKCRTEQVVQKETVTACFKNEGSLLSFCSRHVSLKEDLVSQEKMDNVPNDREKKLISDKTLEPLTSRIFADNDEASQLPITPGDKTAYDREQSVSPQYKSSPASVLSKSDEQKSLNKASNEKIKNYIPFFNSDSDEGENPQPHHSVMPGKFNGRLSWTTKDVLLDSEVGPCSKASRQHDDIESKSHQSSPSTSEIASSYESLTEKLRMKWDMRNSLLEKSLKTLQQTRNRREKSRPTFHGSPIADASNSNTSRTLLDLLSPEIIVKKKDSKFSQPKSEVCQPLWQVQLDEGSAQEEVTKPARHDSLLTYTQREREVLNHLL